MSYDSPNHFIVRARLSLLATPLGGPSTPRKPQYRPSHNFGDKENLNFFIGFVDWDPPTPIQPGEEREVVIHFFPEPALRPYLVPGRRWWIQEGAFVVGSAELLDAKSL